MDWLPFEFGRPWALLAGAACIAATIWIARHSLAGQSTGRRRTSTILRIVLLLLLTLAFAEFRLALPGRGLTVLFLADRSDSIPQPAQDAVADYIAAVTDGIDRDEQAGLIVFGRDASVERRPSSSPLAASRVQSVIDTGGTDLSAALRLADATFTSAEAGGGRRVVLISDGNSNRGDELLEARNLALSGAVIDVLPVEYEYGSEVLVDAVQVPPEVHASEPYEVLGIIHSEVETSARVHLFENGVQVDSRDVALLPGKNRVSFTRRNDAQVRYSYELRVVPATDSIASNNAGHAFTFIRGQARTLFIGDGEQHAALLTALREARVVCEMVTPRTLPASADEFFLYDSIVLADVAAYELGVDAMRLLHAVVKNLGLGFVMIGGPNSFGAGGYRDTPIEQLLPVEMEVKQRKMLPNGALVQILHTCEFPSGNLWAKRIAATAIDALTPQDLVGVLHWNMGGGDAWGVPFGPATDKGKIKALIGQMQPADMPAFNPSMALALQALQPAVASSKHVIIISDGDPAPPLASTMQGLVDGRISVTTVCIAPHTPGGTGVMKKIASETGGRYYLVDDPRELPQIFFREALEVRRNLITEETFTPRIVLDHEVLRGVAEEGLPPLGGYVITTAKPLAETVLVSHYDDPVLCTWRYGLARTAAFTSDAIGRWAREWIGWPGYPTFWAQLVRSVSRRGAGELFQVERELDGERGRILLDAIDPEGRTVDGLVVEGRILDPHQEEQEVVFQQTGPGRYEASFLARRAGSYLLSLGYQGPGGLRGATQTGINVSYSPEYRQLQTNRERLVKLARATGGRVLEERDDPFAREGLAPRRQRRSLFAELLIAALLLFFADVLVRRVLVSLAPLRRALQILRGRAARPLATRGEALGRLLERRDAVRSRTEEERQPRVPGAPAATPGAGGRPATTAAPPAATTGRATPATGSAGSAPEEHPPEAGPAPGLGYTDRLLRAKRQAREKQQREKRGDGQTRRDDGDRHAGGDGGRAAGGGAGGDDSP